MLGWFKKKSSAPIGPNFSGIDSQEKAEELFRRGELEKLFLMPLEFGGQDMPLDVLYVPIGVAGVKSGIDNNIIGPLVAEGTISQYTATPEYQGNSFIPIAIEKVQVRSGDPSRLCGLAAVLTR